MNPTLLAMDLADWLFAPVMIFFGALAVAGIFTTIKDAFWPKDTNHAARSRRP